MKKKVIIVLLFLPLTGITQNSGYLGKKFVVGYNFNLQAVISFFHFNGNLAKTPTIYASTKHEGFASYTFSRRFSFMTSYLKQNCKYYYYRESQRGPEFDIIRSKSYNQVDGTFIDMALRYHIGNFISPLGTYAELGYGVCKVGLNDDDPYVSISEYDQTTDQRYTTVYDGTDSYIKFKRLSIGAGNTKMITDFLMFNMGIRIHKYHNYVYHKNSSVASSIAILDFLKQSQRTMNWLEIKFGIGFVF